MKNKNNETFTRILYVKNGEFKKGGVETFILNYYKELIKGPFRIDFLIHVEAPPEKSDVIKYFERNGSNIYYVPTRTSNLPLHLKMVKKVLNSNKYDIVHTHTGPSAFLTLFQARRANVPVRIAHSHGTNFTLTQKNIIKKSISKVSLKTSKALIKNVSTKYAACSEEAGEFLFGNKDTKTIKIIKNAIDTEKFRFSVPNRQKKRQELGIADDEILIGQIGRFDENKNQVFSIDILKELLSKNTKVHLLYIGEGETQSRIKEIIEKSDLTPFVHMIKNTDEIEKYMSAMDFLLLPSFYEGLPLVTIESQANGLPILFSKNVSSEVKLTDISFQLSLDVPTEWTDAILNFDQELTLRKGYADKVKNAGYDIKRNASNLSKWYLELVHENK